MGQPALQLSLLHMIADCKAGKIDFVITKSISRFARNTTDCLEMDSLSKAIGGEGVYASATQDLLRYVEKAAMLTDFDEALFENTVDRIKVLSREEIAFEIKA